MPLPIRPLATATFDLDGQSIEYRSLSRTEVVKLADLNEDTSAAEAFMVSNSAGVTVEEATTWLNSVDAKTADGFLTAVSVLSGLRKPRAGAEGKA